MDDLVDQIYEAAAVPELWPEVLNSLTFLGDGKGAVLFTSDGADVRWIATPAMREGFAEYVALGWPARTDRAQRLFAKRHAGFLDDLDVYTPEELETEPVFVEFLRPRGYGRGVATAIPLTTGDLVAFAIERDHRRGPASSATISALDEFRPHLARASLLSARLKLRELTAATATLELLGIPAAVIATRRLLSPNGKLQDLIPDILIDGRARVALADAAADKLLGNAIDHIDRPGARAVYSIPIRGSAHRPAYILHLLPLRRSAHDIFPGASAILMVTPVATGPMPSVDILQNLFDLTAAEARIARAVGEQRKVEAIATQFNVSAETVRTQIKSVLKKTGMERQIELAALLASIFAPGGR